MSTTGWFQHDPFWEFEHDGWEDSAAAYADFWGDLTGLFADPMLEAAGVATGKRVLDVACGPGIVTAPARRRGARCCGVDFSLGMIRQLRAALGAVLCHVGDAQLLALREASFDAVVMGFGVLHLSQPDLAFREALRVLVPGGHYAFTLWAKPEENPGFGVVHGAIEKHGSLEVGLPEGPPFYRFSDAEECRRSLVAAGFRPSSFRFDTVTATWRVPTADYPLRAHLNSGVRTRAVLMRQTPGQLEAIRAAVLATMEIYRDGDAWVLPYAAHVISAAKPPTSPFS